MPLNEGARSAAPFNPVHLVPGVDEVVGALCYASGTESARGLNNKCQR